MQLQSEYTLAQLADYLGAQLRGDAQCTVSGLAGLPEATDQHISFVSDPRNVSQLAETRAAAVVVRAELLDQVPGNALVSADPYLAFAKLSRLNSSRQ